MDTSVSIIVIVRGGQTLNINNVCRILTGDIKLNDSHVDITRPLLLVITIILGGGGEPWRFRQQVRQRCVRIWFLIGIREQYWNKMHIWTFGRCSKDEEKELLLTTGLLMQVQSSRSVVLWKCHKLSLQNMMKTKKTCSFSTMAR